MHYVHTERIEFGSNALVDDRVTRSARIITSLGYGPVHFAILSKENYNKCLAKFNQKMDEALQNFLKSTEFFEKWSKT
jgi:hypothetical protein